LERLPGSRWLRVWLIRSRYQAVPTGQVFLRFRTGERVTAHRDALEQAGFTIARELDYAPQAAWLLARSGSIPED
jgi:hypothetical protein